MVIWLWNVQSHKDIIFQFIILGINMVKIWNVYFLYYLNMFTWETFLILIWYFSEAVQRYSGAAKHYKNIGTVD